MVVLQLENEEGEKFYELLLGWKMNLDLRSGWGRMKRIYFIFLKYKVEILIF